MQFAVRSLLGEQIDDAVFRSPLIRLLAAGMAGAAVALGLLAVLSFVNDQSGFSQTTAAAHFGWLVPIVTGVGVGGLAWALLSTRLDSGGQARLAVRCTCDVCGGTVFGDWRLCPHCGYRFPDSDGAC